jgi:hypothetical protein
VAAVLAVGSTTVTKLQLGGENILDLFIFHLLQLGLGDFALLRGNLRLQKSLRTEERAQVLGTERGSLVQLRSHD